MAEEQNTNQTQNEEKDKKELTVPSFDISYTIEITDLKDVSKSRFTPKQLFGFQETKRTLTWNKNILYPSRFSEYNEEKGNIFPSDRQLYAMVEVDNNLLPFNSDGQEEFYALYLDMVVMCIYLVHVTTNKDDPQKNPIDIKVFRRLDRRVNVDNSSSFSLDIADGCEYYFQSSLSNLSLTYPDLPHFECWLLLTGGGNGCEITYPEGTTFANGDKPEIGAGEDWEISIKDKIVVAIMNEEVED